MKRKTFETCTLSNSVINRFLMVLLVIVPSAFLHSQTFSSAGEYNNYILGDQLDISKRYLGYISSVAHSNSMRRIEQKRNRLISKIEQTQNKVVDAPAYNGDGQFRTASIDFYRSLLRILNDDYSKIAQLEDAAQSSYENMEAYYNVKDEAEKKYQDASTKLTAAQKEFARKYNLQLKANTEMETLDEKFKKIDEVNSYYEKLHLIFFKAYKTEGAMMQAMKSKDYTVAEQKRKQLSGICKEGLTQIASVTSYENDGDLMDALKEYLQYGQDEADVQVIKMIEFTKKQAAFEKIKQDLESTPKKERTQKDVDKYNKAVNEFNAAVTETNKVAEKLSRDGQFYLDKWNNGVQSFMDKHIPHYEDEFEVG